MSASDFRFLVPRWRYALWLVGLVSTSFLVFAVAAAAVLIHRLTGAVDPTRGEIGMPTVWALGGTALLVLVAWVSVAWGFVSDVLLARRGRVCAADQGISVTNGWGITRSLCWSDVSELRVLPGGNRVPGRVFPTALRIQGTDRIVHVPSGVQGASTLVETIIAQAGLNRQEKAGRGTKYLRPETED